MRHHIEEVIKAYDELHKLPLDMTHTRIVRLHLKVEQMKKAYERLPEMVKEPVDEDKLKLLEACAAEMWAILTNIYPSPGEPRPEWEDRFVPLLRNYYNWLAVRNNEVVRQTSGG